MTVAITSGRMGPPVGALALSRGPPCRRRVARASSAWDADPSRDGVVLLGTRGGCAATVANDTNER